ncbi:TniQ family protein [Pantanalinema rosaneae CENA516]|uniref:TniQ family protein n=1 Tax=Pantanalinema rosaneae TaxID=1620701 RepID=UPI003D70024D
MPVKSYSADTFWNLDKPFLPGRSRLLPLKPIGIGTLHVESLTGYIARLAQAHCLTTEELLSYEIMPLMNDRGFQVDSRTIYRLFGSCRSLPQEDETRGDLLKALLQALEELTGRQDLLQLSVLQWASEIFAFSLSHPYQAWCPVCYQEWRNDNRVIYAPLLWLLLSRGMTPFLAIKYHIG